MQSYNNIDEYIDQFPAPTQKLLTSIRTTIQKTVPLAKEAIKYGMPTYVLGGNIIHFACFKNHIGLYPGPGAITTFNNELEKYPTSKGTIQFPIDGPIPLALIKKIVQFNVERAEIRAKLKSGSTKKGIETKASSKKTSATDADLLPKISAPARRVLEAKGIKNLRQLSKYSASELLELHGFGPSSIPIIEKALKQAGLKLKSD